MISPGWREYLIARLCMAAQDLGWAITGRVSNFGCAGCLPCPPGLLQRAESKKEEEARRLRQEARQELQSRRWGVQHGWGGQGTECPFTGLSQEYWG